MHQRLGRPVDALWRTRNGYALAERAGLDLITAYMNGLDNRARNDLAGKLRIGIHRDVGVTDAPSRSGPIVSQAFCRALPLAYNTMPSKNWQVFAQFVLDTAYEVTMLEAVLNAQRGTSNIALLTMFGGGGFGNDDAWIPAGIQRAVKKVQAFDLDVRLESYRAPSAETRAMVSSFQA
jgi:hypothetical protein